MAKGGRFEKNRTEKKNPDSWTRRSELSKLYTRSAASNDHFKPTMQVIKLKKVYPCMYLLSFTCEC